MEGTEPSRGWSRTWASPGGSPCPQAQLRLTAWVSLRQQDPLKLSE